MKLFLDYISKIKFYIILQLFPVMLAEIIFFLYQLPIEPMVYVTVFWLITDNWYLCVSERILQIQEKGRTVGIDCSCTGYQSFTDGFSCRSG